MEKHLKRRYSFYVKQIYLCDHKKCIFSKEARCLEYIVAETGVKTNETRLELFRNGKF